MKRFIFATVLIAGFTVLSSCAPGSVMSVADPMADIDKTEPIYIEPPDQSDIYSKKIYHAILVELKNQKFNVVENKSNAKYLINHGLRYFNQDLKYYDILSDMQTTYGQVGDLDFSATTYGVKTHPSTLTLYYVGLII